MSACSETSHPKGSKAGLGCSPCSLILVVFLAPLQ